MKTFTKTNTEETIKSVAIYARKSRAIDEEEDLESHLIKLVEIAESYEWEYEIYKEVKSGATIDGRPQMLQLLQDVDDGLFDAILAFDMERLSRGSGSDRERLMYHLSAAETKIVLGNPFTILDPNDEADTDMLNMRSFFSNYEMNATKRRFRHGKKIGAAKGNFVYGQPSYGYKYNRETKRLVPNEYAEVVRRVAHDFVSTNKSTGDIAWELNAEGILSSKGSMWSSSMIRAMLLNDSYLGHTVYNKSTGTYKGKKAKYNTTPFRKLPKEEWKTVYNTHEPLITKEQREYIDQHFTQYRRQPKKKKDGSVFDLSGLCKTPGGTTYTHQTQNGKDQLIFHKDERRDDIEYPNHIKVNCDIVRQAIKMSVAVVTEELSEMLENNETQTELESYKRTLNSLEVKYEKLLNSMDRIDEGFLNELYDLNTAKRLKIEKEEEKGELESQILKVRERIDTFSDVKVEDRIERLKNFERDIMKVGSNREINSLYKSVIKDIIVDRTDLDRVEVKVNFL